MKPDTILCVGYARLPEGMTAEEVYKIFGVGLEIETQSKVIIRAQTTCATVLGDDFITRFFIGRNIETDFNDCIDNINKHYRGIGVKAILAASKKAYNEYLNYKNGIYQS